MQIESRRRSRAVTKRANDRELAAESISALAFLRQIQEAKLPLPRCPCCVEDCYAAYVAYCTSRGEWPSALNSFAVEFIRQGIRRVELNLYSDSKAKRRRRVFLLGERSGNRDLIDWARAGVIEFAKALSEYRGTIA